MKQLWWWQLAAVGAVLCLGFSAKSAGAAPLWFKFYGTSGGGASEAVDGGEQSFRAGGVTVTVRSHPSGTNPSPTTTLIRNTRPFGGFGVGPRQRNPGSPELADPVDAVGRGESLFLSFDREVTLTATVSFDVAGGYTRFQGPSNDRTYQVWRWNGESSAHAGDVNPTSVINTPDLSGRPSGTVPFPSPENALVLQRNGEVGPPILAPIALQRGQTLRGTHFELRTPESASGFHWFLGGVAADAQPMPEPSTALLTGAGLLALGFAARRRRRRA